MNLATLRYVVTLARERHFGRAAKACFVSQPTLSVAVKKFENELGVTLFERSRQQLRITTAGKRIVEQAQQALEAVANLREAASSNRDQLASPLRIGAIYTVGPYLFPQLIVNLRQRAPRMPLVVEENFTAVLGERLKQGRLDVIIVSLPFDKPGVQTCTVYDESFVVLLPASHTLAKRGALRSRDLQGESMLMLGPGHCFRDQVIEACPACAPKASAEEGGMYTFEGATLGTICHMVASGMGLTVLPASAANATGYLPDMLITRPFANPVPNRPVALAWRDSFPRPRVIDVLHQAIAATQIPGITHVEVTTDVGHDDSSQLSS